jgi:DNA-binding NtrC family response regulator
MALAESAPGQARTVLVVEDDAAMRATLRLILERFGYGVREASDGTEVPGLLQDEAVGVILLDLAMPKVNGLALLEQIDVPPPVVVIHSAFEFFAIEQVQELAGTKVFRYLRKPCPPQTVVDTVGEAYERWMELKGI